MSYANQTDIEDIFGPANIAAWSRFESGTPTGETDLARVASALAYADGEINGAFLNGPYIIPLACNTSASIVRHWAAGDRGRVALRESRDQQLRRLRGESIPCASE